MAENKAVLILSHKDFKAVTNSNVFSEIYVIKHMVNASSCTVMLWMHFGDVLGGLLRLTRTRGIVY